MGNIYVDILSICSGLVFTLSLVFQLSKSIRSKSAKDLSYFWLILSLVAILGGLFYGIWYSLWPIYVANSTQAFVNLLIIIVKIILDRRSKYEFSTQNV